LKHRSRSSRYVLAVSFYHSRQLFYIFHEQSTLLIQTASLNNLIVTKWNYILICIFWLFNNTVNIETLWNRITEWLMIWKEFGREWLCHNWGLSKYTKNLSQDRQIEPSTFWVQISSLTTKTTSSALMWW
jgi:hypothetical protein